MEGQYRSDSGRARGLVIFSVLVLLLLAGAWYWYSRRNAPQQAAAPAAQPQATAQKQAGAAAQPHKITQPVPSPAVVDLDNLRNNAAARSLMERRKRQYGVGAGVDAIVKSDESIKLGGITIPMSEILEKIRLKKGDVIEKSLDETPAQRQARLRKLFYKRLAQAEETYHRLKKQLAAVDIGNNPQLHEKLSRRLSELEKTMERYDRLKTLNARIDALREEIENLSGSAREAARAKLKALLEKRESIEAELRKRVMPSDGVQAYGIYVVRPGDNIWNIHFLFLRDYFARKGITLSPRSDEPDQRGYSSGVGKILKFSEKMVYIYNIRQHKLDVNLNLIHPRSKIVVFNMAEALSLLDQIDYRNVKHIRFDGETLWIPAEQ